MTSRLVRLAPRLGRGSIEKLSLGRSLGFPTPNAPTRAMARWPKHRWTSLFTYGAVFVLLPLCCLLAYAWVRGWKLDW